MMTLIEQFIINALLIFTDVETLNTLMRDPQLVAVIVGGLVATSGAMLGTFLLLRKMALTSDAISHTVLLGIVGAFFVLIWFGQDPSLSSPWLLIGATIAGVATVVLTEIVQRSGLVKSDAALGLVFPLLFAIAVILISRFAEDVHLDTDAVLVGEIGIAWANTNSYCLEACDDIIITPDDPRAEVGRACVNCSRGGINPRDPEAIFEETCSNCGTYTAAQAWRERLIDAPPTLVFWPQAITLMGVITLLNLLFVGLFYKELKLAAFDEALAKALGFRPAALSYALMTLVSLTAVGAFDAVGSILVVAFFVIPPAIAYLLTNRLWLMLLISPIAGIISVQMGYGFARGDFILPNSLNNLLAGLNALGASLIPEWNVSISASIVIVMFLLFLLVWIVSPQYGLIALVFRRAQQRRHFADEMLLAHICHHQGEPEEATELAINTLHEHLGWTPGRVRASLQRTRLRGWVQIQDGIALLTARGKDEVQRFRNEVISPGWQNDEMSFAAVGD